MGKHFFRTFPNANFMLIRGKKNDLACFFFRQENRIPEGDYYITSVKNKNKNKKQKTKNKKKKGRRRIKKKKKKMTVVKTVGGSNGIPVVTQVLTILHGVIFF